jgi:hypothetical protein
LVVFIQLAHFIQPTLANNHRESWSIVSAITAGRNRWESRHMKCNHYFPAWHIKFQVYGHLSEQECQLVLDLGSNAHNPRFATFVPASRAGWCPWKPSGGDAWTGERAEWRQLQLSRRNYSSVQRRHWFRQSSEVVHWRVLELVTATKHIHGLWIRTKKKKTRPIYGEVLVSMYMPGIQPSNETLSTSLYKQLIQTTLNIQREVLWQFLTTNWTGSFYQCFPQKPQLSCRLLSAHRIHLRSFYCTSAISLLF